MKIAKRNGFDFIQRDSVGKNASVCSRHFKPDEFVEACSRNILVPTAVPSILPVVNAKMFTMGGTKMLKATNPLKYQKRAISPTNLFHRGVAFFFSKKNLLFTNSITSGGFMLLGDIIQQEAELHYKLIPERYDWGRCGRMFLVGTLMGPLHHFYYVYLDKVMPNADIKTVLKKIACDQLFASPATILCFFYAMGKLENKTFAQSNEEIKNKFKYVYLGDCLYWPPVQFLNFYYLPTRYRVLAINVATMVFNVFLSCMKHYDQH